MVGMAPLLASRGDSAGAKEVLETSMQLLVEPGDADLLLAAAGGGDPAVVRALLESGADPGLGSADGTTPLMAAARWRRTSAAASRRSALPGLAVCFSCTPSHALGFL